MKQIIDNIWNASPSAVVKTTNDIATTAILMGIIWIVICFVIVGLFFWFMNRQFRK